MGPNLFCTSNFLIAYTPMALAVNEQLQTKATFIVKLFNHFISVVYNTSIHLQKHCHTTCCNCLHALVRINDSTLWTIYGQLYLEKGSVSSYTFRCNLFPMIICTKQTKQHKQQWTQYIPSKHVTFQ
jgi:hypothetical protein